MSWPGLDGNPDSTLLSYLHQQWLVEIERRSNFGKNRRSLSRRSKRKVLNLDDEANLSLISANKRQEWRSLHYFKWWSKWSPRHGWIKRFGRDPSRKVFFQSKGLQMRWPVVWGQIWGQVSWPTVCNRRQVTCHSCSEVLIAVRWFSIPHWYWFLDSEADK